MLMYLWNVVISQSYIIRVFRVIESPIATSPGFYVIIDDFSFNLVTTSDLCVAEQDHARSLQGYAQRSRSKSWPFDILIIDTL